MSAEPPATRGRRRRLSRDRTNGIVAGVCAGIARRAGVDPIVIRVGFVVLAIATSGAALAAYALAWVFMDEGPSDPAPGDLNPIERALGRIPVRNWRVAAGVGFLTLALLLVLREIGLWWSDAVIWPAILAASGAALLWRQSRTIEPGEPEPAGPGVEATTDRDDDSARAAPAPAGRFAGVYSGGFGIALVLGAALLFLYANGALGRARDVVLGVVVAALALSLILAPFLWRLGRNLAAERAERIRSQERAELAAHLHDSVLQTLTLVQKRASDPREVASLARRQERELRSWLHDGSTRRDGDSLVAALEQAAAEVEDAHAVTIELVAVGDRPLDGRGAAIVAATREALTNSAKFAGDAAAIAVYAEIDAERAQVFVRDRGAGFELAAIPADRRGVRDSIVGRMRRHGGEATIRSGPGGGTEVELTMPSAPE